MSDKKKKSVEGYLVYNYHQDDLRLRKSKPSQSKMSPHELPLKVSFEVRVPKMDIPEISKTIEIPEAQVREAVTELAVEPQDLETDYPDPKMVLNQNGPEELREQFEELGLEDVVDAERDEMISWLRQMYSTEMETHGRDGVLEVIEESLMTVRKGGE